MKLRLLIPILAASLAACAPTDDPSEPDGPTGKADSFAGSHPINVPGGIYGESVFGATMLGESYGTSGPTLFLAAAIHGNELSAITFGERVRTMLLGGLAERYGIRIFFVQAANPDGIASGTRENANGIDLNRNFPAENFDAGGDHGDEPLTEPESRMLHDALNATAPVGVVSIHCCIPTFDLDGPSIGLARAMDEAMYDASGMDFTLEDLPAYGGSMGSYVSQILGKPIVTVEFASAHEEDVIDQQYGMEAAIEAAAEWTAQQEPTVAYDIDALEPLSLGGAYESFSVGTSAGGLPIRAELVRGNDDRNVALLAGFDGTERRAEFVAAYARRLLLANLPDSNILIVNGVNPDGLGQQTATNADGVDVRAEFSAEVPAAGEAAAVRDAVIAHNPELVVVAIDSYRDAISAIGPDAAIVESLVADRTLDMPPDDTEWLQAFVDSGATVMIVEVASEFAESQDFSRSGAVGVESQGVLGGPIVRALL